MTILAELFGDLRVPHNFIRVGQQENAVIPVEFLQFLQALHGNPDEEIIEGIVNLLVGHSRRQVFPPSDAEPGGGELPFLQRQERPFLTVITQEFFGMFHTKFFQRPDAPLLFNIHDYSSEIEEEVYVLFFHNYSVDSD